jgi:hypothetical protein
VFDGDLLINGFCVAVLMLIVCCKMSLIDVLATDHLNLAIV